jgi:RNA polymerase sigma-70 factor (ECF subfamily)
VNENRLDQGDGAPELAEAYLEGLARSSGTLDAGELRMLAAALRSALEAARSTWPSLDVDSVAWARHLGRQEAQATTGAHGPPPATASDLYLAFACGSGDSDAIAALERRHFGDVRLALASAGLAPSEVDEVLQQLRERLFVASGGMPPRILTYLGRGPLAGWLRVAAVRLAVGQHRSARVRPEAADEADLERLAPARTEPEAAYLRARYRVQYERALKQALDSLTPQQRNLMRLHYVEGIGVEKLGRLNQVHASTASRWIAQARTILLRETERIVRASLSMSEAGFESLLRVVRSDLHLSLAQFLPAPRD